MHLYLQSLRLYQFKNYETAKFEFSPQINCFVGLNGSGKTNVLDAIYYLCFTKSYFQLQDQLNILHQQEEMSINGVFTKNNASENIQLHIEKGSKKKLKINNTLAPKLAEHIGSYPLVIIAPNDIYLIHEGSEERRKFIDSFISQFDKVYLYQLIQYNKALEQRNALLKQFFEQNSFDANLLAVYDQKMSENGQAIYQKRQAFIQEFEPLFKQFYNQISEETETITLSYQSQLHTDTLASLLQQHISIDKASQRTTKGTHKDDFIFEINGYPLRKMGSQGQQKSYIIALKLAQYSYLQTVTHTKPLLLLDDIFEKLDNNRLKIILNMIADDHFGQIFISDTDKKRLEDMLQHLQANIQYFSIQKGKVLS
jgi:DNA replication and repair protein RecF